MRIVGGMWRGRPLRAPMGRDTRPTTDRVRESVASILAAARGGLEGARVLDAFAGSGALALEMLSRGAQAATLLDSDPKALGVIRANVQACGAGSRALVARGDALALAARGRVGGAPFDLVLLDPPYALPAEQVARLVEDLDAAGLLMAEALVLYERADRGAQTAPAGFELLSTHRYGSTCVDVLGRARAAADGEGAGDIREEA